MWVQGVLVVLLSGLSAPGRAQAQAPRCRVGERLPVPGLRGALAPPPRSRCPCVPLRWVRLAAAGAGLALGLLWIRCRRVRFLLGSAPDDAPPSPEPPAPRTAPGPGLAEVTTGLGGPAGDLAAPELHTSLALGEEVRVAAHQGFDAHRAAQELLGTSFLARCSVEGKAAAGMNIPREQQLYQGLVSLQVPAEEVLSCALQEKLSLVRSQPEPHREPAPEGPDLLMFYEPRELFAETPYLGVEGLPPLRLQPHVRPPASAFLMFRKLQQWEA
ncbi:protein phosphatase 1 regulatory subunit 35 [Mauremys reevesii]|uniref:protein phosphatase 1 regulatory subunit 35 n=1 Tax=Mauremys reevesii TaxID=260615 RepID=UPI00193ED679|nr:protein phosphatase 1 regulatory subunit 35 [Mauremys reevesii]